MDCIKCGKNISIRDGICMGCGCKNERNLIDTKRAGARFKAVLWAISGNIYFSDSGLRFTPYYFTYQFFAKEIFIPYEEMAVVEIAEQKLQRKGTVFAITTVASDVYKFSTADTQNILTFLQEIIKENGKFKSSANNT